jgi:ribosomal protein S13
MEIALTYIYGIGRTTANKILLEAEVSADTKSDNLTDAELTRIRNVIDSHYKVEGDLRREISMNIKGSRTSALSKLRYRNSAGAGTPTIPTPDW